MTCNFMFRCHLIFYRQRTIIYSVDFECFFKTDVLLDPILGPKTFVC
jgi:hypothetical protein